MTEQIFAPLAIGTALGPSTQALFRIAGIAYLVLVGAIADFYVAFAVEVADAGLVLWHVVAASAFSGFAILGTRTTLWWAVAALSWPGLFVPADELAVPSAAPGWWSRFCLGFDLRAAVGLAVRLRSPWRHLS